MNKVIAIGLLFLVLLTLGSGCKVIGIDIGGVGSEEEATEVMGEVIADLDDLAENLDDINDDLG